MGGTRRVLTELDVPIDGMVRVEVNSYREKGRRG
jgi:hypothetical protein